MRSLLFCGRLALSLGAACWLCACPSLSTLHTARPVAQGETQVVVAAGAYGFHDIGGDIEYLPFVEAEARRGFGPRWDAGAKIGNFSALQADLNYALVLTEDFALSVDPTVSITPVAGILVSYFWLPVLADVLRTERFTLTLAVKPGYAFIDDIDAEDDIGIGASGGLIGFGASLRYRASEAITLHLGYDVVLPTDSSYDEHLSTVTFGFVF